MYVLVESPCMKSTRIFNHDVTSLWFYHKRGSLFMQRYASIVLIWAGSVVAKAFS